MSKHGLTQQSIFLAVAVTIGVFLAHLSSASPELPLQDLTGQLLHRLAVFLVVVVVALYALGGRKFQILDELKANLVAFAIVTASVIVGAAMVLSR